MTDLLSRLQSQSIAALMAAAKALKPLADHVSIFELGFSAEEIAAIDKEHHLIAHGITLADAYRARDCLAALEAAGILERK